MTPSIRSRVQICCGHLTSRVKKKVRENERPEKAGTMPQVRFGQEKFVREGTVKAKFCDETNCRDFTHEALTKARKIFRRIFAERRCMTILENAMSFWFRKNVYIGGIVLHRLLFTGSKMSRFFFKNNEKTLALVFSRPRLTHVLPITSMWQLHYPQDV